MLFAPVSLNLLGFKINSIDNGAVTNLGPSQHLDQLVSYKRNQGIGEMNGDFCAYSLSISWVTDTDLLDNPTIKNSFL
ncbi:hypothetical protein ACNQFZ_07290 [Schinkia sp. CFF1]